jgi:hypothetical protein
MTKMMAKPNSTSTVISKCIVKHPLMSRPKLDSLTRKRLILLAFIASHK